MNRSKAYTISKAFQFTDISQNSVCNIKLYINPSCIRYIKTRFLFKIKKKKTKNIRKYFPIVFDGIILYFLVITETVKD